MISKLQTDIESLLLLANESDQDSINKTSADERLKSITELAQSMLAKIHAYQNNPSTPFIIEAEAHSDDFHIEVKFDAVEYFQQADDSTLLGLIECGFGGDYPSDYVVEYFKGKIEKIDRLFAYTGNDCGFECFINSKDAIRWIVANKAHVYDSYLNSISSH